VHKRIDIVEVLQSADAVSVSDGERIEHHIRDLLTRESRVEVSLGSLEMATTAFVNAMVIPLYESFDAAELDARVAFVGTEESDQIRISRARERGIERRVNPPRDDPRNGQAATL